MFLPQAIRDSRLVRWAAIALALNTWMLIGVVCDQLRSGKSASLVISAADVRPMHDAATGTLNSYYVENIPVDRVGTWAKWPSFAIFYAAIGINMASIAWMLRLAVLQHRWHGSHQ